MALLPPPPLLPPPHHGNHTQQHLILLYQLTTAVCLFLVIWTLLLPGTWMWGRSQLHDAMFGRQERWWVQYQGHTAIHFTHMLPGAVWAALIPLQLHEDVRKYSPKWHRRFGYVFFVSSLLVAGGLCLILHRGILFSERPFDKLITRSLFSYFWLVIVDLIYFTFTALFSLYLATQQQFVRHQTWVIRHIASGIFVAPQQIWMVATVSLSSSPMSQPAQRAIFGRAGCWGLLVSVLCGEYAIYMLKLQHHHQQSTLTDETTGISMRQLRQELQRQTEITAVPWEGKSFQMIVHPNDRIADLKRDLQLLTQTPVSMQILLHDNKQLHDAATLRSYNIGRGAILHQQLQPKGG